MHSRLIVIDHEYGRWLVVYLSLWDHIGHMLMITTAIDVATTTPG